MTTPETTREIAGRGRRRRVTVVVNPKRSDAVDELVRALSAGGVDVEVRTPGEPDEMVGEIAAAARREVDVVAAVGGDGTHRLAAGVLHGSDTALATVPAGTVNLLARLLGIDTVDDVVAAILGDDTASFDVGLVDGEPFVLFASTGFDAEVMDDVDDAAKRFGVLGYAAAGLARLRDLRPRRVRVVVDGSVTFDGRAIDVVVTNVAERADPRFEVAPDATPDDGRLDVVVARCSTVAGLLRAAWSLLRGRRPDPSDVGYAQGRTVDVEWRGAVASQRDGDGTGERRRVRHEVAAGRVRLCTVPERTGP